MLIALVLLDLSKAFDSVTQPCWINLVVLVFLVKQSNGLTVILLVDLNLYVLEQKCFLHFPSLTPYRRVQFCHLYCVVSAETTFHQLLNHAI